MTQRKLFPWVRIVAHRTYGGMPPHVDADTSRAAAEQIEPTAGTLRAEVLAAIRAWEGATDEQLQEYLHMPANTQRPRRRELVLQRLVVDSGQRRATNSGRQAIVWIATNL